MATTVPVQRYTARDVTSPKHPRTTVAAPSSVRRTLPPVDNAAPSRGGGRFAARHTTVGAQPKASQHSPSLPPIGRTTNVKSNVSSSAVPTSLEEKSDKLRTVFRKFDTNNDGTISRHELEYVLTRLGDFRRADIDAIMLEVDKNQNGVIEYDEFLLWLVTPGCALDVGKGRAEVFDVKQAMRPLFDVYDVDQNNKISKAEFIEMQSMIKAFLASEPGSGEANQSVALLAAGDVNDIFGEADADHDEQIDFDEFIEWQREAIMHSGVPHDRLTELCQKLAVLLQAVVVLLPKNTLQDARRYSAGSRDPVLVKMVEECAATCRELWKREKKDHRGSFNVSLNQAPFVTEASPEVVARETRVMQETPQGLSVSGLLTRHLAEPLHPGDHDEVNLQVQMYPAAGSPQEDAEHRWVARVDRQTLRKSRKVAHSFYFYEFSDNSWAQSQSPDDFHEASASLSPQLRCYALLLAKSQFQQRGLPWRIIEEALHEAAQCHIFTKEELLEYIVGMENTIIDMCSDKELKKRMQAADPVQRKDYVRTLMQKVRLSPLQVMASLTDMDVLPGHALWTS